MVGSILAEPDSSMPVPKSVMELTAWMIPQRARGPKARPTVAYFQKMAKCLAGMQRVLKRDGHAALVVGKRHVFYELSSMKTIREYDMASAMAEIAADSRYGVGFHLERIVTIELRKLDYAARPGAKGHYHEAILLLRPS
jgi:hypothetical protein